MCNHYIGVATMATFTATKFQIKGVKIPCGSWNCPDCAKRKQIILGNRVKEGLNGERIRFVTLTAPNGGSLATKIKNLKVSWNRLSLALKRHFGLSKFFWVLEFGHEKGRPHLHILINCYVPQRALSRMALQAGFGAIADIREVKQGGGFGYVYKYLGKDCGSKVGAATLRIVHGRRYGTSRNIKPVLNADRKTINLNFLKDCFDDETLENSAKTFAANICRQINAVTKKGAQIVIDGVPRFSTEDCMEICRWYKSAIIGTETAVECLGYEAGGVQKKWLSAILARNGFIDEDLAGTPFEM